MGYVIFGAVLFHKWEKWRPLDSVYFVFVTLTTIGFGDFVPKVKIVNAMLGKPRYLQADQRIDKEFGIAATSMYLLFGMSLLVMTFNLVQQRVVDKVRRAGIICGVVKDDEDDEGFGFE